MVPTGMVRVKNYIAKILRRRTKNYKLLSDQTMYWLLLFFVDIVYLIISWWKPILNWIKFIDSSNFLELCIWIKKNTKEWIY